MALFQCPRCGTPLAYASKDHPCKGGKSSDGIAEGREAQDSRNAKGVAPDRKPLEVGAVAQLVERGPSQGLMSEVRGLSTPVGTKAGPSEPKRKRPSHKIIEGLKEAIAVVKGEAQPAKVTIVKVGRPKRTEAQPWEALGISKASYYRRQAKAAKGEME